MTLHSRSNRCTVGSSKTVAVDLFDSIDYCQDELGIMTLVQRSYLHKHPTLWLEKKVNEGDHLDDDPTVPEQLGAPYFVDNSSHTHGLVSPTLPPNDNERERNLSVVLRIWDTTVKCSTYNAAHLAEAAQWLIEVEMIQAHPDTWHSGQRQLQACQTQWDSFKCWPTRENPIATSKQSVVKAGNVLHQGPNKALDHFMKLFSQGQTHAKTHSLLYDEGTTFVMKLNTPLAKKLDKIMATEELHRFLMSFCDIQNTAVDKNSCLPTQNLAFTSATSERSSGGGQSGSGKKTKGDTSDRICYNCNQPGHVTTACTEPQIDKQLWYKTKRAASGFNSVPSD
ncbi:hypothetical protein MJO28_017919 [Puccinia striiformis f. sp. tritici]|nr:hypothetical protein MJO28_017919 [Puccinia striiformis f. sp. tritici]